MSATSTYIPPDLGTPEVAVLLETPTPEFETFLRSPAWLPWLQAQLRRCDDDLFVYSAYWDAFDASLPPLERHSKSRRAMARAERVLDAARHHPARASSAGATA